MSHPGVTGVHSGMHIASFPEVAVVAVRPFVCYRESGGTEPHELLFTLPPTQTYST